MGKSLDDLKNMFDKGRYELAQSLRATHESVYLAPEYNNQSMDERQKSYLEQAQESLQQPERQKEQQQER